MHPDNGILLSDKKEMRYQATKRHGHPQCIFLSKSQSEKATYYMILNIGHSEKDKTMTTEKRSVVASGWGVAG